MAVDFVTQKINYFNDADANRKTHNEGTKNQSLLEEYLKNPNIDLSDITGMAGDMLLAGIDTV